ncbi:hypothetical protein SEA_DRYAD_87 [Streptomyces phage Dryad]|nr:hypothetical protein SEA_DRYAD_87 [Streptomyces phage Dryad]
MARVMVRPSVIEFLTAHEGMVVNLVNLMRAMPEGAQESSVRNVIRQVIEDGTFQITVLAAGHSWRVDGITPAGRAVYGKSADAGKTKLMVGPLEILGNMEDGSQLARDNASGKLYTLRAL